MQPRIYAVDFYNKLLKKHNLNFIFYSKDIKTESKLINLLKDTRPQ